MSKGCVDFLILTNLLWSEWDVVLRISYLELGCKARLDFAYLLSCFLGSFVLVKYSCTRVFLWYRL
jgi:hypothetical protein